MCALGDVARDFVEVELHHVGVGIGKRQGRSDAPRWADRAEQIGVEGEKEGGREGGRKKRVRREARKGKRGERGGGGKGEGEGGRRRRGERGEREGGGGGGGEEGGEGGGEGREEKGGVVVALIGGLSWSCSAPGPLADEAVLLADPGFVLEPDFDRRRLGQPCEMSFQRTREVFLNPSTIRSSWAG